MHKHLVRHIKTWGHVSVANAMYAVGYYWENPKRRPTNIEKMLLDVPRCDLLKIIGELEKSK